LLTFYLKRTIYSDLPSIIFGVTGILSGVVTLFLPETKDSELMDNIQGVEKQGKTEEGTAQIIKIARRLSHPNIDSSQPHQQSQTISLESVP